MLWAVFHLLPSGDNIDFNCYYHHYLLILRNGDEMSNILHSREVLILGDPLAMFAYGIGFLLLMKHLKSTDPDVSQPWYKINDVSLGTFGNL